jgi:hypothetical protein
MCNKVLSQTWSRLLTGMTALRSVETRNSTTAAGQNSARMTYYYTLLKKIKHESTIKTSKIYEKFRQVRDAGEFLLHSSQSDFKL